MNLRAKFLLLGCSLAMLPALALSLFVSITSYEEGKGAIEDLSKDHLVSIRESKKSQIERYFETIQNQVLSFSKDRMIVNAMREFRQGFDEFRAQSERVAPDQQRNSVEQYYREDYLREYQNRNGGASPDVRSLLQGLDADSMALQYAFIAASPEPLGAKDALVSLGDNSLYSKLHEIYHPPIRDYLQRFEYYDIFLVAADTGDIVYSVFKELDYTTSLKDGPYAKSGIGRVFKQALESSNEDAVAIDDFHPYTPSYQDPAAFIASPIFDQGRKIGVLIFQMPIDRINAIMTHDRRWLENGLGASGETYLVGADFKMRSLSRFLIEDKAAYLQALESAGESAQIRGVIETKNTSIGLQSVNTEGAQKALGGETGYSIFDDYRGVSVLSAYAPLSIPGLQWVIMSEIDESEAFHESETMFSSMIWIVCLSMIGLAVVAVGMSLWFSSRLASPIVEFTEQLSDIVERRDLTLRVPVKGKDEIARGAKEINKLLETFQRRVSEQAQTANQLSDSSKALHRQIQKVVASSDAQEAQSQSISSAATELTATAGEVAASAEQTSASTGNAHRLAEQGKRLIEDRIESIRAQAENIGNINNELIQVSEAGEKIARVLQVISDIAEQTNLLALNAAIEAARAGDQGRGFAVVADEVRSLAQKTHASTDEIHSTIASLHDSISRAQKVTEQGVRESENSVEGAGKMRESLSEILEQVIQIQAMNEQVASAATEQLAVSDDIAKSIIEVNALSEENRKAAQMSDAEAESLDELVEVLRQRSNEFKA